MDESSEETPIDIEDSSFKADLPDFANFERINAFEDMTGRGESVITCIYGPYSSGKSRLVNQMVCDNNPIILDGDSIRYYVNSDLFTSDDDQVENAKRMARLAIYFAMQGQYVILNAIRADAAYNYIKHTLEDVQSRRTMVKKRYQQGVNISIHLLHTEGTGVFPKS